MKILDACCGSKMFWYNKHEPHTTYMDIRRFYERLETGHVVNVDPELIEVIPEKKWNVKVPAVDSPIFYYKTVDGIDVCKPSPNMQSLTRTSFTAKELKHYGLDNDLFEKVEVNK